VDSGCKEGRNPEKANPGILGNAGSRKEIGDEMRVNDGG